MTLILSLLKTYLIFIIFSLIISLFGYIFIYIFQKHSKKKWNLSLLEYGFISYAVGILIYILISYILSWFKLFNFYTAFLPFLIISLIFLLFLFKKRNIRDSIPRIRNYLTLNYKEIVINIFILTVIFLFQFLTFWPKVSKTSALLSRDPYYWTKQILYLNENGIVNYSEHGSLYPWGFIFFCGGNLLISNDFITTYYFMKLACFPFLNFYILVMFSISKRIYKKKFLIFFCLISILSQVFFMYRTLMFLSSSIAVLLILISLIILLTEIPNYFLCFIIPTTFLFNPVYAFYFILALSIFYIIKLINLNRNRILIYKEIITITSLSAILVIPYIMSAFFFYGKDLINLIDSFSRFFEIENFNHTNTIIEIPSNFQSKLFLLNLFNIELYEIQFLLYIGFIFLLPIWSFFLKIKTQDDRRKDFIIFLKVGFILTIFILLTIFFFSTIRFFKIYFIRILEAFIPFLILLSGFFFEQVLSKSEKLWYNTKLKFRKVKSWTEKNKFNKNILNLPSLSIILMLVFSLFAYNYSRIHTVTHYYYDDSLVKCCFYINENIEENTDIAVYDLNESSIHSSAIYYLLYRYDLIYYRFNGNVTLNEFWVFLQANTIANLIINLSYYTQDFIDDFSSNSSFNTLVGGLTNGEFSLYQIL